MRRRASGGRPPAPPNVGFARRNLKCSILDRSTVPPFEAKLMSDYWIWWIAAALLVGAELLTGTYYLLAVGLALGIGGLAAWLGASAPAQLAVAAVAGVLATIAAHQWRMRRALPPPQPGLDIGQPVRVEDWNADGTARVAYRGTQWTAELAAPDTPRARTMYIVAMRGSILVVADRRA